MFYKKKTLGIVILNWNRLELLRATFYSLLHNTDYPIKKLIIVDNASTDGSVLWIKNIKKHFPKLVDYVLNDKNIGGEAINLAIEKLDTDLILISENDLEYLPDWQKSMIMAFNNIPNLGQLSPFSPFPQVEMGEVWEEKPFSKIIKFNNYKIYETVEHGNVGTTCMIINSLAKVVKWNSRIDNSTGNDFIFPDDGLYSQHVKDAGYRVFWSGEYFTINWGHNLYTWLKDQSYYRENYKAKTWFGINGVNERLKRFGYKFVGGKLKKSV